MLHDDEVETLLRRSARRARVSARAGTVGVCVSALLPPALGLAGVIPLAAGLGIAIVCLLLIGVASVIVGWYTPSPEHIRTAVHTRRTRRALEEGYTILRSNTVRLEEVFERVHGDEDASRDHLTRAVLAHDLWLELRGHAEIDAQEWCAGQRQLAQLLARLEEDLGARAPAPGASPMDDVADEPTR